MLGEIKKAGQHENKRDELMKASRRNSITLDPGKKRK